MMKKQALMAIRKHNMLKPDTGVVLGLSGGADSVALLHFLRNFEEFSIKIVCVHINHGLRGFESDADEAFCEVLCREMGVEIFIFKEDVAAESAKEDIGLEEAGRRLRYARFHQVLDDLGYDHIAVAHNKNDVAETVLMQILRGTGTPRGILPRRDKVIRPLINAERLDIETYCRKHGLDFRADSTNFQNQYTRNKIRNVLLPMIKQDLSPAAVDSLARLANVAAAEDLFLDNIAKNKMDKCFINGEIVLDALEQLDLAIKRRVVRLALTKIYGSVKDIAFHTVEDILALETMGSGKQVALSCGFVAEKVYRTICITKPASPPHFSVILSKRIPVFVPQASKWFCLSDRIIQENAFTMPLNCDRIDGAQITVRGRLPGDTIYFDTVGTKKIKDFFIDKKIPRSLRDTAVFVAYEKDIILMVSDFVKSDKFKPEKGSDTIYLQIWEE